MQLAEFFQKMYGKASHPLARLALLKALKRVLKARTQNASRLVPDLVKTQTKFLEKAAKGD